MPTWTSGISNLMRWVRNLGSDHYNLPNYWEKERGGRRWGYWQLNAHSHNVITFEGGDQDADATARMTAFQSKPESAHAVVDLSEAYTEAERVVRGVAMLDWRKAVLVQDEISTARPQASPGGSRQTPTSRSFSPTTPG